MAIRKRNSKTGECLCVVCNLYIEQTEKFPSSNFILLDAAIFVQYFHEKNKHKMVSHIKYLYHTDSGAPWGGDLLPIFFIFNRSTSNKDWK